jgi:DNA invertase Pin-like site-specific DNA recombinase
MKGTISEFELNLFRQRSSEAIFQKTRRGELQIQIPVGFCWAPSGLLEKIPTNVCSKPSSWCFVK